MAPGGSGASLAKQGPGEDEEGGAALRRIGNVHMVGEEDPSVKPEAWISLVLESHSLPRLARFRSMVEWESERTRSAE